ncbi:hypothetical protein HJFPF1_10324 [Paramyrothecium foliicola]|nr:hypothetical protein HJFPF1_10324 [Paramyrothecium foliicola]
MVSFKSAILLLSAASHAIGANCSDYGSWHVYVLLRGGAQGHRNGDTYVEHSKTPGVISHWGWAYWPETGETEFFSNSSTLNTTRLEYGGLNDFEIRDTVLGVPLKGAGTILLVRPTESNGRSFHGNATIVAELDN